MIDLERKAEDRLIDLGLREVLAEEEIAVADPPSRRLRGVLELAAVAAAVLLLLLVPPLAPRGGLATPDDDPDAPRLVFRRGDDGEAGTVATMLRRRLQLAGVEGRVTAGEEGRVTVDFPEDVARVTFDRMKEVLLRRGMVEMLPVAPADVVPEDPGAAAPPGYRWVPEAGSKGRRLVEVPASSKERFTSRDFNRSRIGVEKGAAGLGWVVMVAMNRERRSPPGEFEARIAGSVYAIVVDGEIVAAARVVDRPSGLFLIRGGGRDGFDRATAEDLALVLSAPPLPARVEIVSSRPPDPVPSERLVVPGERVGPYQLGQPGKNADTTGEPGVMIDWAIAGNAVVINIRVTTDRYRTAEGIGVGSTVADVYRAFGAPGTDPDEHDGALAYPGIMFVPDGDRVGSFRVHYGTEER